MIETTDGMNATLKAVRKIPNSSNALLARALTKRGLFSELNAERNNGQIGRMSFVMIAQFLDEAKSKKLSFQSKLRIIDQAIVLLEQYYAHLPFKRAVCINCPSSNLNFRTGSMA